MTSTKLSPASQQDTPLEPGDAPPLPYLHIEPSKGWVSLKLRELWEYRELLYFLTWRDIKVRYKQTVLGAAWAILQPFLTMVVFSLFFGRLAGIPSDGIPYPLFAEIIAVNQHNYLAYQAGLANLPGVKLFAYDQTQRNNFQYVILEIDEAQAGIGRDQLVKILHAENVLARRYFYPGCHQMEPYRSYYPHAGLLLPETERLTQRVMSLPTGTAVDEAAVKTICEILAIAIHNPKQPG